MPSQGLRTGEFGEKMTRIFQALYRVYYDHGDRNKNSNVYACKGFYGEQVKNINRFADIDFIIGNSNGEALIVGEIEERASSPKKIIGDIFAIAMCNQIAIKKQQQEYYRITPITQLLIGGIMPIQGVRQQKIKMIHSRLQTFQRKEGGFNLQNVHLFFEESIDSVLEHIEAKIKQILA